VEVLGRRSHGHLEAAVVLQVVLGPQQCDARIVVRQDGRLRGFKKGRRAENTHPDVRRRRRLLEQRVDLTAERVPIPNVEDGRHRRRPARAVLAHVKVGLGGQQLVQGWLLRLSAPGKGALSREPAGGWHYLLRWKRLGLRASLVAQPRGTARVEHQHGGEHEDEHRIAGVGEEAGQFHLLVGHRQGCENLSAGNGG